MIQLLSSACNLILLALDSQQAAQLRLLRLGQGGTKAVDEAILMVQEKIEAASSASISLAIGGSIDEVVRAYRGVVRANIERLSI